MYVFWVHWTLSYTHFILGHYWQHTHVTIYSLCCHMSNLICYQSLVVGRLCTHAVTKQCFIDQFSYLRYIWFHRWTCSDPYITFIFDRCHHSWGAVTPVNLWMKEIIIITLTPGVCSCVFSILLFSQFFKMIKTLVTCMISHSHLTGVTPAELWRHLTNMDVIENI